MPRRSSNKTKEHDFMTVARRPSMAPGAATVKPLEAPSARVSARSDSLVLIRRAPDWPPAQCDIRPRLRHHRRKSRESCKSLLLFFLSTHFLAIHAGYETRKKQSQR
jgi:hypothetical protein